MVPTIGSHRRRFSRVALLAVILCAAIGDGVFAATPPTPAAAGPDPLDPVLKAYAGTVRTKLAATFRVYESFAALNVHSQLIAPPAETLDRMAELDALGALPVAWVNLLNRKGDEAQSQGEAQKPTEQSPEPYQVFESRYAAHEPGSLPLRTPEELAQGLVLTAPPATYDPPFKKLQALLPHANDHAAEFQATLKQVEAKFTARTHVTVAAALMTLRTALQAAPKPGGSGSGSGTPWTTLGSPGIQLRVNQYLAERYFKGRWITGRRGPQSTGNGTGSSSEGTGKGTGDGITTNSSPAAGGSGTGGSAAPPGPNGTGTGSPTPSGAPLPYGSTGGGKSGSGPGTGSGTAGSTGTGGTGSGQPK